MPTVEDYFDDETDLPLPSASGSGSGSGSGSKPKPRTLQGQGLQGALLEEISTEDPDDDFGFDYGRMAEQGRGIFGENSIAPPPEVGGKGKVAVRDSDEQRPSGQGQGQGMNPNTPMGGFMGDMMRMQQAEEERLEKLRKQFGSTTIAKDPSVYKEWNSLYPIYFDAKVSIAKGRRVPREYALWWPQAQHLSIACRNLGLQSCLEPTRTHPADFENPGRVKVLFKENGKYLNPIIKNRTQLYNKLAEQLCREYPSLSYTINPPSKPFSKSKHKINTDTDTNTKNKKPKSNTNTKGKEAKPVRPIKKVRTRPPIPPQPVLALEERLPLHSPLVQTGIALSSIKRDLDNEKEQKKKALTGGQGEESGAGGAGGKDKQPKMKRVVVRGKR